jgi:hypothetical protein
MSDKTIILTITVYPFDKGKRRILVAGAPQGEMPIARPGLFHELHDLVDQLWLDLAERKPQTVHVKKGAPAASIGNVSDEDAAPESDATEPATDSDAVRDAQGADAETSAPAALPSIQGDDAPTPALPTEGEPGPDDTNSLLPQGEGPGMPRRHSQDRAMPTGMRE